MKDSPKIPKNQIFVAAALTQVKYQGARFEFCKEQLLILGAIVESCFGNKMSNFQLYFTGVFKDIGSIFPTCSKMFTKILKGGKIFRCVTSFYQYFFASDKICYQKADSGNSCS